MYNNNQPIETKIEGYKQHNPYYEFIKELYESVSITRANFNDSERFKKTIEMMRELIDNTYPYHMNNKIELIGSNNKKVNLNYVDYFEYLAELYFSSMKLQNEPRELNPHEQDEISDNKGKIMTGMRYIRREIIKALSDNAVIPKAEIQILKESELESDPVQKEIMQGSELVRERY